MLGVTVASDSGVTSGRTRKGTACQTIQDGEAKHRKKVNSSDISHGGDPCPVLLTVVKKAERSHTLAHSPFLALQLLLKFPPGSVLVALMEDSPFCGSQHSLAPITGSSSVPCLSPVSESESSSLNRKPCLYQLCRAKSHTDNP